MNESSKLGCFANCYPSSISLRYWFTFVWIVDISVRFMQAWSNITTWIKNRVKNALILLSRYYLCYLWLSVCSMSSKLRYDLLKFIWCIYYSSLSFIGWLYVIHVSLHCICYYVHVNETSTCNVSTVHMWRIYSMMLRTMQVMWLWNVIVIIYFLLFSSFIVYYLLVRSIDD